MNRQIEIVIEFNNQLQDIASSKVTPRPNLKEDQQYTDEQLQWYNDLIDTICNIIENYSGFTILNEYQSSKSYSYYIEFEAFTQSGESLGEFTIKFRISDHYSKGRHRYKSVATSKATIFRSIVVNNISQDSSIETATFIQHICDELLLGNVAVLDELR